MTNDKSNPKSKVQNPTSLKLRGASNETVKQWNNFPEDKNLVAKLNKTIKKVTHDIEKIKNNTAIAAMMEMMNDWEKVMDESSNISSQLNSPSFRTHGQVRSDVKENRSRLPQDQLKHPVSRNFDSSSIVLSVENAKKFLQILAPFAPHMTEEIWRNVFGEKESIHLSKWPEVQETVAETVTMPIQVNGKVRSVISLSVSQSSEKEVVAKAVTDEKVKKFIEGKKYKAIYIKGKILNLVVS